MPTALLGGLFILFSSTHSVFTPTILCDILWPLLIHTLAHTSLIKTGFLSPDFSSCLINIIGVDTCTVFKYSSFDPMEYATMRYLYYPILKMRV